jgi:hypothetical protein
MACALTKGFTLGCRDALGGVKEIYVTEFANKATLSETSGVVTTFTLDSGKQFWTYEIPDNTAQVTETVNANTQNGTVFYSQELPLVLHKLQTAIRNELKLLAQNRIMVIVKDANDTYWLLGKTIGAWLTGGTSVTGVGKADASAYNITLMAEEPEPMTEVNSDLIATLTAPAA